MSAGRTWPPRSAGPGGQIGLAQASQVWNPAKFAVGPEVAVDSTGAVLTGAPGGRALSSGDWAFLLVTAGAFYIFGARHLGGRMVPFRHMDHP